jgi:hypothetical protein
VQVVLHRTLCCTSRCVLSKVHAAVQGVLHAWLAQQCCPEQGVYAGSTVHATSCCYVSAAVHESEQHAVGSGGAALGSVQHGVCGEGLRACILQPRHPVLAMS